MMVKCPKCNAEIESDSFYCDQCGDEIKICTQCGTFGKGKRCTQCGNVLIEAKNAQQPASAAQAAQPSQSASPTGQPTLHPQSAPAAPVNNQPVSAPVANSAPAASDDPDKTVRPGAPPAIAQYLVCHSIGARLELRDGAVIGRRSGDYVSVFSSQGYVSGTHARLQKNGAGSWEIVDMDSTNGTFVNGSQLAPNQAGTFKIGDTVRIATLDFKAE